MKPVISGEDSRKADSILIHEYHIPGIRLMEHASEGVFRYLRAHADTEDRIAIVCGTGNNGGDGFFVAALLTRAGYRPEVYICGDKEKISGDALIAYQLMTAAGCNEVQEEPDFSDSRWIVDALFGTGLSRMLSVSHQELLGRMNASDAKRLAIDIPSGIDAGNGLIYATCFHADVTITFHYLKKGQLLFPGRKYCGEIILQPIADAYPVTADTFLIEEDDIRLLLPPRPIESHKGSNGHALLIAGSARYSGAAMLAALSALRGGCGITTVAVPGMDIKNAFMHIPEVIACACGESGCWNMTACREAGLLISKKTAIGIGPGMGSVEDAGLVEMVLSAGVPCVVDADGLNCLAAHPELLHKLHDRVVITPHPGEMARLTGASVKEITASSLNFCREYAAKWKCIVLLKGATTCISDGRNVFLNTTGNPGLAKGGSGDVLTGMILAMLSQGLEPLAAAKTGAYLLGATAGKAFSILRERMLAATDLTDAITEELSEARGC